jgi:hypothetical protein
LLASPAQVIVGPAGSGVIRSLDFLAARSGQETKLYGVAVFPVELERSQAYSVAASGSALTP